MSSSQPATAHVVALLEAYHADALAPAEATLVEQHLRDCSACQQQSEQIALYQLIRTASAPTVGPELRDGLYARIAAVSAPAQQEHGRTLQRTRRAFAAQLNHPGGERRAQGWLSGAAAVATVALLVSVFWALPYLNGRGVRGGVSSVVSSPIATVPAACPASATSATIPKDAFLTDLALTSPTEGWAVGSIVNLQDNSTQGVILRFHQCHWTPVALNLPNVGLTNISMDSPTDGWAVGNYAVTNAPFLLHYNNGAWKEAPLPSGLPSELAVAQSFFAQGRAGAPGDVWITAFTQKQKTSQGLVSPMLLLHPDNGNWATVTSPLPIIYTVAPVGPNDLWIVGGTSTTTNSADTYRFAHYHAGQWSVVKQPAGAELTTLHAISPTDVWASGSIPNVRSTDATTTLPVVAHYDGVSWQVAPQAIPPSAGAGVMSYALGDGEGWAERTSFYFPNGPQAGSATEALSSVWSESGGQWQALPWPYNDLHAMSAWTPVSSGEVWTLASHDVEFLTPDGSGGYSGSGYLKNVLLHYADGAWTRYG